MKDILPYLKPYRRRIALAMLLVAAATVCDLLLPTIMNDILNNGVRQSDFAYIVRCCAWMLAVAAAGLAALLAGRKISCDVVAGPPGGGGGCVFHCPTGPNDTMLPLTGPAFYPFLFPSFTASRNTLDGLKAGMEWAGITIVVFFVMLRATFSALSLTMKLPNPRKNTSSPAIIVSFMFLINASTTASAAVFSTPV